MKSDARLMCMTGCRMDWILKKREKRMTAIVGGRDLLFMEMIEDLSIMGIYVRLLVK